MTPTRPDRPPVRRVPVALYIATSDEITAHAFTGQARAFAEARDWTVALTMVDNDPTPPLDQRSGWQVITNALNARTIHGVVTWTHDMVTGDRAIRSVDAHDCLPAALRDRGGFLTVAHTVTQDHGDGHPPRRTSGDLARRRALTDAAASFAAFRSSLGGPHII
ncbi:hypothetical protein ACFRMQ_33365 [Kitasatospora sp. NPDC056783]|uniref:hypothetical protein n=1 Tax=Kitasatospora sp. NPDC056783 TaxID=3345943 RepID=UPI0036CB13B3